MIITIDGPTASGKSSVSRALAQQLGFYHINTGLLYRALAFLLMTKCNYQQAHLGEPKIGDIQFFLNSDYLHYRWDTDGNSHLLFHDVDITHMLKQASIDQAASRISTNLQVRTLVN